MTNIVGRAITIKKAIKKRNIQTDTKNKPKRLRDKFCYQKVVRAITKRAVNPKIISNFGGKIILWSTI